MALLSIAVVSCTMEKAAPVEVPVNGRIVTLGATISDTKAAISDEGKFTWQAGDAISVLNTDGGFVEFDLTSGAGTSEAVFQAFLPSEMILDDVAISPAAGEHYVTTGEDIMVRLPQEYTWAEDVTNVPLIGVVDGDKIAMRYIGGVIRIPLVDVPATAATVLFAAADYITGAYAVDPADAESVLEGEPEEADNTIMINIPEAKSEMVLNIPVPVGEYEGFELMVLDADGEVLFDKESEAAVEIEAGTLVAFNPLSLKEELVITPVRIWAKGRTDLGIPVPTNSQSYMAAIQGGKVWVANEDKVYGYDFLTGDAYKTVTFPVPVRSLDSDDAAENVIWAYERGFQDGDAEWAAPEPVYVTTGSIEEVGGTLEEPVGFKLLMNANNSFSDAAGGPVMSNFKITGSATGDAIITYGVSSWGRGYAVPLEVKNGAATGRYIWISTTGVDLWNAFNTQAEPYSTNLEDGIFYTHYSGPAYPICFSNNLTIGWANGVAQNNFDALEPVIDNKRAWAVYRTDIVTYKDHRLYAFLTTVNDRAAEAYALAPFLDIYDVTDPAAPELLVTIDSHDFLIGDPMEVEKDIVPGTIKLQVIDDALYAVATDGVLGVVNVFQLAGETPEPGEEASGSATGPDWTVNPGVDF